MPINKNKLFKELLTDFLEQNIEVEAIIVSDEEGLIIAGEKRRDIDIEIVSFLTAVVNPIIDRVRNEFSFKKFGTASFDTDEHRLLFISLDEKTTLSLVVASLASLDAISPYAYYLAEKTAQILNAQEGDNIQIDISNFEFHAELGEPSERLKNQIYQSKLEMGGAFRFKFIIIGDHEVGKTSIIRRFVENRFLTDYRATIGLNIMSHDFEAFGNRISLFLWDIGAQKYFKRYRKTYYNGAQAAFMVFDLTKRETFDNLNYWHNELKEFIQNKDLPIVIVGNKTDLEDKRAVRYEEGVKLAKDLSMFASFADSSNMSEFSDLSGISGKGQSRISYIETSALNGDHIEDAFSLISYHFIMKSKEIEEKRLKNSIIDQVRSIIDLNNSLTLSFITEDPLWSPGLQIITEISDLGSFTKAKDKPKERIFKYDTGLLLKSYTYESFKISDSDGVFCIFDARERKKVDSMWLHIVKEIIKKVKKNKVILIGIRVSDDVDWSKLMEDFNVNEEAEERMVSLLFFKIGEEFRLEIYDQLAIMLDTIKNLLFAY